MAKRLLSMLAAMIPALLQAQDKDSAQHTGPDRQRLRTVAIAGGTGYGIALVGLNELWYKDYPRQSFRFFNDNAEWKQVDKIGHFYSAFYLGYGASKGYEWCGIRPAKADLLGALTGFMIMLPIEIFDGFSQAYGASAGDLIANAGGSMFFLGQKLAWKEVRIYPRFSFHRSDFAKARPGVLGDNLAGEILKDYNGQTYWLSFDLDKFFRFPKWLNFAAGYGADGMVYARDEANGEAGYDAYRQYYLSLDIDLTAIQTRSKAVRTVLFIASLIKWPSPTVEISAGKTRFHFLY